MSDETRELNSKAEKERIGTRSWQRRRYKELENRRDGGSDVVPIVARRVRKGNKGVIWKRFNRQGSSHLSD